VSSPHSLSILLIFVDACSESSSNEQLRSYTKHSCEQINQTSCSIGIDRQGGEGEGGMYSTICLATRTLTRLQAMCRLAHACSTKPVYSYTHLTECFIGKKGKINYSVYSIPVTVSGLFKGYICYGLIILMDFDCYFGVKGHSTVPFQYSILDITSLIFGVCMA